MHPGLQRKKPVGRKGLVEILLCKISARPCILDCSGNPFCEAKRLERKARFLPPSGGKNVHRFS
jgi:hypothetical protein